MLTGTDGEPVDRTGPEQEDDGDAAYDRFVDDCLEYGVRPSHPQARMLLAAAKDEERELEVRNAQVHPTLRGIVNGMSPKVGK